MERETRAFGAEYHQDSSPEQRQVDELMIANMLNALNNPNILKMLDDEELKIVLQTVKNHIILKAQWALPWQEEYVNKNSKSK